MGASLRTRIVGGLLTAALLLPGAASAQELDPCYIDPLAPGCVEVLERRIPGDPGVGGADLCVDPVTGALIDLETGEVVAGEPAPGMPLCDVIDDEDEVDVEVLAQVETRALADTGIDLTIGLLGLAMVGLGTLFVVTTRRRRTGEA